MTTELETNIVAVESEGYTETPTEVNSSYFIYIPTQGVVSEEMTTELETNIVAVERVKNIQKPYRESEGNKHQKTPTEVNSSYFIYISSPRRSVRMTTDLETNIVAVESEGIHRNSCRGVVSENDNRVRDKHCSCRKSEGIHRNSYRGVVSENDNRVRDKHCSCRESEGIHRRRIVRMTTELETKHCSCRESEGIHRNSYRGVVSENDNRVRETNIVAVERVKEYTETPTEKRVKEYTETPTEVNSSYFIYIPTQGVVSENDNRVRDKHCSKERE
ncbi:ABCC1 [Mytilus edulis]|uniref:ABCC1 n=1 Tax=Mytilus edulis TaxID=6550 RepID=A0A8S3VGV9_MYTED|nr:ABCC1 [Mytilus edulis]